MDAVVLVDVLKKKSRTTPKKTIEKRQRRLAAYDKAAEGWKDG
jgi:phage-related protein